jgi:hypothetical protein
MNDKIIQIATIISPKGVNKEESQYLYALTESGNVYRLHNPQLDSIEKPSPNSVPRPQWSKIQLPDELN